MRLFKKFIIFTLMMFFSLTLNFFYAKPVHAQFDNAIGEAFGKPVTSEEFLYHLKTASLFTRLGATERDAEETRQEAWQNLIYLYEATSLGVKATDDELKAELERLVSEKGITYGTDDYYKWIKTEFNEDPGIFEKRIEDLITINKFLNMKTHPDITVTEEDMKEKFLNQYNSFESEYIMFDTMDSAQDFAEKVRKKPALWRDEYIEKKKIGQEGAAWINIMSMEALIDLWKIPKEDAYEILSHKEGDFIVAHNYYGIAVFRLLYKREADLNDYTDKKKEYYRDLLIKSRKHTIVKEYFEELLKRANYRDYVAEEVKKAKIEDLKRKSFIVLKTNRGEIGLKLFPEEAPFACENFIGLVEKGYYDGIIFHRVIKDFMIQGGDPIATGTGGDSIWGKPFVNEISEKLLFDKPGILAMANSGKDTNKSQFFITVSEQPSLDGKYTIFGEVIAGYDVVEKISLVKTDSKDKPEKEQKIIKAYQGKVASNE